MTQSPDNPAALSDKELTSLAYAKSKINWPSVMPERELWIEGFEKGYREAEERNHVAELREVAEAARIHFAAMDALEAFEKSNPNNSGSKWASLFNTVALAEGRVAKEGGA